MRRFCFILVLLLASVAAQAKSFHPPQTEAEKALDEITTHITENDVNLLHDVQEYLAGRAPFKYERYFTRKYLKKWMPVQQQWLKDACEGRSDDDEYKDCSVWRLSCIGDLNPPYIYRTLRETNNEAIILYAWAIEKEQVNEDDSYIHFHMRKIDNAWKLDRAPCGDDIKAH